jgi:hypothetical protein
MLGRLIWMEIEIIHTTYASPPFRRVELAEYPPRASLYRDKPLPYRITGLRFPQLIKVILEGVDSAKIPMNFLFYEQVIAIIADC